MDEEWDTDNFKIKEPIGVSANKWEGEDEDEDVKDSWDAEEDEEEEKKDVEKPEPKKQKPKKSLQDKIAEKEKAQLEELERKLKEKEKEDELTPEERLRRQKESDLNLALETTFGIDGNSSSIDSMNPTTKEEFAEFSDMLNKKLMTLAKSPEFPTFAEDHIRNLCVSLSSLDLKKLKLTIDNMYIEKQKVEKGDKAKKNKGKGKVKLRMEGDNALSEYSTFGEYDEYDDFM